MKWINYWNYSITDDGAAQVELVVRRGCRTWLAVVNETAIGEYITLWYAKQACERELMGRMIQGTEGASR